jgi:hypothetical protein
VRPLIDRLATRKSVGFLVALLASAVGTPTNGAHLFGDAKQINLSGRWRLNQQQSAYSAEPAEGELSPERVSDIFEDWAGVTNEKQMNATGSAFVVITRTIYTDGRPSKYMFTSGDLGESRARWAEQKFIVETKTARGSKLTETYELSPDRKPSGYQSSLLAAGLGQSSFAALTIGRRTSAH